MTDSEIPRRELSAERQRAFESLFAGLPDSFEERYAMMQSLRRSFYAELAKRLEPALNAHARSLPRNTWEERAALASWINRICRQTGLALVCPHTNRPAILISDVTGRNKKLHFRFQTTEPSGRRVRSAMSVELPDLELTQAPLRVENLDRIFRHEGKSEHSR